MASQFMEINFKPSGPETPPCTSLAASARVKGAVRSTSERSMLNPYTPILTLYKIYFGGLEHFARTYFGLFGV